MGHLQDPFEHQGHAEHSNGGTDSARIVPHQALALHPPLIAGTVGTGSSLLRYSMSCMKYGYLTRHKREDKRKKN